MRQTLANDPWELVFPPDLPGGEPFAPCSYALCRADGTGAILASRAPTRAWDEGCDLLRDLALPSEVRCRLGRGADGPLFTETAHGIGFFSKRYARHAGLWLFVHIHAPRASVARLLNAGVLPGSYDMTSSIASYGADLQPEDEAAYLSLSRAWGLWRDPGAGVPLGFASSFGRSADPLYDVGLLSDWLLSLSEPTGCVLSPGSLPLMQARLFRPELYEAWFLMLCSLAFSRGPARSASFSLSTHDARPGGRLRISVSFPLIVDTLARLPRTRAEQARLPVVPPLLSSLSYLEQAASWNGAAASHALSDPYPAPLDPHLLLSDLTADLVFLSDPTRTPADLKAGNGWKG